MKKLILCALFFCLIAQAADDIQEPSQQGGMPFVKLASGKAVPLQAVMTTDGAGALIPISSGGGGGDATAANQVTGNNSLSSIDGKITAVNTGAVVISSSALPTGASTSAAQTTGNSSLSSIDGKITAVNTGAVVISSSALPSGASTEATLSTLNGKVTTVDTDDVTISSSALPTGAATSANQTTGNSSLSSIDGKIPASLTVTSTRLLVDGSGVTQPVSASALPLPTGASTETTLASLNSKVTAVDTGNVTVASSALPSGASTGAKQDTGNSSLSSIDGKLASLGQKAMTGSVPVVIASDQSAVKVSMQGKVKVALLTNDYTGTNVTTSAYVQLTASTSDDISRLHVFDSSGQALVLAVGAAASEVDQFYIPPGGIDSIDLAIPSGSRISIKAVSATASSGALYISTLK